MPYSQKIAVNAGRYGLVDEVYFQDYGERMIAKARFLAAALAVSLLGASGCEQDRRVERWVTTDNTKVRIDWDRINEAYKQASGPEDLEKRVNEIYEGDEVISVAVHDQDDKTQVVTGFFDKDADGQVADGEKIFSIKREPTGEGTAQYQTTGFGPYYGYHSPLISIASGMLMGSLISSMFMPNFVPAYSRPYVTPVGRIGDLHNSRSAYRASTGRVGPRSQSGRSYGGASSSSSGGFRAGGRRGGGSFGLPRRGRASRPARLTA